MRAIRPLILVQTNPQEVQQDSSLIISARFYNKETLEKLSVKKIYMNIISTKDGHEVWPNEVVRRDTWKFDIEISTKEMKPGHKYLIRISNNQNQSPQGSTEFKVIKNSQIPLILFPIIPMPLPKDEIEKRMILLKIFRTQMDARVCPFCIERSLNSSSDLPPAHYYPNDPDIPFIPVHFNCRCTFDIIFLNEFEGAYEKSFESVANVWLASQNIPSALQAIKAIQQYI